MPNDVFFFSYLVFLLQIVPQLRTTRERMKNFETKSAFPLERNGVGELRKLFYFGINSLAQTVCSTGAKASIYSPIPGRRSFTNHCPREQICFTYSTRAGRMLKLSSCSQSASAVTSNF